MCSEENFDYEKGIKANENSKVKPGNTQVKAIPSI